MTNIYQELTEKYPFISYIKYADKEFVGIILNKDANIVSIYDYDLLPNLEIKQKFLELGDVWWWESNRLIPINLFLGSQIKPYRNWILNMNSKDVQIIWGPETSLNNIVPLIRVCF